MELMSLSKLCQLALRWKGAGRENEAGELVSWLLQLEPFPSLWCPDQEYDEAEGRRLFELIRGLYPHRPITWNWTRAEAPGIDDPQELSCALKSKPLADGDIKPILGKGPGFNLTLTPSMALTLDGDGTTLGVIREGDVEIRAFGPQSASLVFGIQGRGLDGWTRTAAFPEVWLEMKERERRFDFRFVGLSSEQPLSFAFYVKAKNCQIDKELFKPRSLNRYQGEARGPIFNGKLKIESGQPHKVQLIPLAGEGCFWNCDFLLLFELHPLLSQISFFIHSIFD